MAPILAVVVAAIFGFGGAPAPAFAGGDVYIDDEVHPDTYFCGAAPIIDGYPTNFVPRPTRYQVMPYFLVERGTGSSTAAGDPALHTPEAVVRRMRADGAICVKTYFEHGFGQERDLPVPKVKTIRALVRAAHAAKMPVFLHANSSEAQAFGLAVGADIMAHGTWHWSGHQKETEIPTDVARVLDGVIAGKGRLAGHDGGALRST